MNKTQIKTLGDLVKSGYKSQTIKEELRSNLIGKIRRKEKLFETIKAYDETVIPDLQRAILSRHNILLLGLRGQAKTRIAKATVSADEITITTWLVVKPACLHGEDEDAPLFPAVGAVPVQDVRGGPRRIESITAVYRSGEFMTVETTTSPTPGGEPRTTTTTYRK